MNGESPKQPRPLLLGAEWFGDLPGGLNRYFHDLLVALSEDGGEPPTAVVVGPATDPLPGVAVAERNPLGARLWQYARASRALRSSPQVVDSHFPLYGLAAVCAGAAKGSPLVAHFHGPWAEESSSEREARSKIVAKLLVERVFYKRATAAVTLTSSFKRLLVQRYGVQPWIVTVVPPAVDLRRFEPGDKQAARESISLPPVGKVALSVRRLVPRMGLETLLRAWARTGPPSERTLLIVGDGPERQSLERLAETLGISPSVQFRGAVSDEELVAYYQAADVSVVPTTELEGFGLIVLESLACGTPVISSDVGGLPEATTGLEGRILVKPGEPDQLGDVLGRCLDDKNAGPSSRSCRAHAERFSSQALARRHREIYRRALTPSSPRKLRVVYLDHCARLSGAELALLRTARALSGVDAHVILGEEGPLEALLWEHGVSTEVLPLAGAAREMGREQVKLGGAGIVAPARAGIHSVRLARRLRALRPDLVHANTLKSGLYGAPAARLAGRPFVWHVRDSLASGSMPKQAAALVRGALERMPERVIVNSEATRDTLGASARRKAVVIASPVALPASPVKIRDSLQRVGILGRIAPSKGQDLFLRSFARAFPGGNVEAVVIGSPMFGEEVYEDRLVSMVSELRLDGRVSFRGFADDIYPELARLDALVNASTVPEGLGQVVIEGMASGLPVIAPGEGGTAEIIRDGVDGLLFAPRDEASLAERLLMLAGDRDLRARLGFAARNRAAEFSPESVGDQVESLYRGLMTSRLPC